MVARITSTYLSVLCFIFNLFGFCSLQTAFNESEPSTYQCPLCTVELLVSPLVTPTSINLLQLSWRTQDIQPGDYVALYQEDPVAQNAEPLFSVPVDVKEGWVTSHVQQDKKNFTTLTFSSQCLGYWIAYKNNITNRVLASSCLNTKPRWMEKYRSDIEELPLKDVFFPGTHNSGCYIESSVPFYETMVQKYVYTQDESILNQLIYGARYLDLRVGYYPDTEAIWWLNHDFVRVRPLKWVLDDIILFVNMTKEIVIIDVHGFPVGFSLDPDKTHTQLQDFLKSYLRPQLVPWLSAGWSSTLWSVWNTGRQIILSYNKVIFGGKEIWTSIDQKWGNVQKLDSLKKYFDGVFQRFVRHPWAAMVELTPIFLDVVIDRPGGLRKMADTVNKNVTRWFQGSYGKSCNIVAVDFLKSTGIVQTAIDWNRKRALQINC